MNEQAPISVIVRSMDRPTLDRALTSIAAQTLRPREIIVVAACGMEHRPLPDCGAGIPISLVFPTPPKTRLLRPEAGNTGLRAATSEWIGFLDDDDELMPHHFATLYPAALAAYRKLGNRGRLAYSLAQGVDEAGNKTDVYGRSFTNVQFWQSTILSIMNGLFHRSLLADGCAFDENLAIHEDWDFWLQCAQHTTFTYIETITSIWHGAEGDSGCGFGRNHNLPQYQAAQASVLRKWAAACEAARQELARQVSEAAAAHARGDIGRAIQTCQAILRNDPENVNAANLLGMISLHRGDLKSAHQLMTVAIAHAPPHFGLYYNMGLIEEASGNAHEARKWFEKGLALQPAHAGLIAKLKTV